jgi:hypothetical protein
MTKEADDILEMADSLEEENGTLFKALDALEARHIIVGPFCQMKADQAAALAHEADELSVLASAMENNASLLYRAAVLYKQAADLWFSIGYSGAAMPHVYNALHHRQAVHNL